MTMTNVVTVCVIYRDARWSRDDDWIAAAVLMTMACMESRPLSLIQAIWNYPLSSLFVE